MSDEPVYELAYREAVRAVEHQHSTVTELRNRSGILVAAARSSSRGRGRS